MKKSQLRNIIRESIKELITEQSLSGTTTLVESCMTGLNHDYVFCLENPQLGQIWSTNNTAGNWFVKGITPTNQTLNIPPVFNPPITGAMIGNPCNPQYTYGATLQPSSTSCPPNTFIAGCTDSNAYNHDPNATQDDGSCDYGFYCKPLGDNPKFGSKCTPANQSNPGPFATLQDCLDSGCELKSPDKGKTIKEPTANIKK